MPGINRAFFHHDDIEESEMNNFYIPITDMDDNMLLTSEEYNRRRAESLKNICILFLA
jgi:hypothetical protein